MDESNKPYNINQQSSTCIAPKDNVNILPKKKHGMVLNFESKGSSVFGADQTPTPTRFIRNCEEVGLFQDLQNVNPFEETFRKAVESGKTGSTALQNCRLSTQFIADDTLHTPHVFPHVIDNDSLPKKDSLKNKAGSEHGQPDKKTTASGIVVPQEADTSQLRPIAPKVPESAQPVQIILEMPDGRLMQLNATPLGNILDADDTGIDTPKLGSVIFHTSTSPNKKQENEISPLLKKKLKSRLGNQGPNEVRSIEQIPANKQAGARNKRAFSAPNTSSSDENDDAKRKKFLERNRAAAMRCREKRKAWLASLERYAEQLITDNQQRQVEAAALRKEVAQLKTLLLAHKDCNVTRAMCDDTTMTNAESIAPFVPKDDGICSVKPLSPEEADFRKKLKMKMIKRVY